jgi:heptosyltransferase-2
VLLVGGEADAVPLAAMQAALAGAEVLVAQHLPLPVLAAILERCRLFLGHDSGISHIAAAVETPCVLLFGPTDPAVWAPKNERVKVITADSGDLRQITPAMVQAVAEETLSSAS